MSIDGYVSRARVVARRLDVANCTPGEHVGNVLRDVRPVLAAVAGDLHEAVIRSHPDRSRFFRRFRDREHYAGIFNTDVVAR